MSDLAYIYVLIDPRDSEVRYVGWTNRPLEERLATHLRARHRRYHRACWISKLMRLGTDGGQGTPGQVHSRETRAKMSAAARRRVRGPRGPMSEAQKAKLRRSTKRQMADPAQRAAVSRVHKGKIISPQQRRAVGDAATQRWEAWRAEHLPNMPTMAERYLAGATIAQLAAEAGVSLPTMRRALLAAGAPIRRRGTYARAA